MGSKNARSLKSERDHWNYYQGSGRRREIRRSKLRRRFETLVKKGLTARAVAQLPSVKKKSEGSNVHPDSFVFLLRHGVEYPELNRWEKPPTWGEPARKRCFGNSSILMRAHARYFKVHPNAGRAAEDAFVYVEGIAFGPTIDPMAHAWNASGAKSKKAIDWTFYAYNNRATYFGLMLREEEYEELCECIYPWLKSTLSNHPRYKRSYREHHIQVFGREYFARIDFRLLLRSILERRKKTQKKKPKLRSHT